ncbi:MAG: NAD-dependent epimerase/dehydratase family protein [Devosia sp.]
MSTPNLIGITGISGFIAKHCAVELLRHGYRVRGTLRNLAKADEVRTTLANHCDVTGLEFAEADLLAEKGWEEAANGLYGMLHLASPFPDREPKNPDELIRPAVDGTLRVLKAAAAAGVQRFVQTSSVAAIMFGHGDTHPGLFTEDDWTIPNGPNVSSYAKSKTLAERTARTFLASARKDLHYSTINPGFVLGPVLDRDIGTSAEAIANFMKGKYPGCPRLSFPVVDVRDIARMHRLALETLAPSGGRYLGVAEVAWFVEMMRPIKARLGDKARRIPVREWPNSLVRLFGLFDPAARGVVHELGRDLRIDNSMTRDALGMEFIPVTESAPAMAQSLVDVGLA